MKKHIVISLFFILSSGHLAVTQDNYVVDSLIQVVKTTTNDTLLIQLLNEIAEEHMYIDHEKVYDYAQLALENSEDIDYKKGIAIAYNNLGSYYRAKGIYNESIDYYFNALEIMEELGDTTGIGRCYNLIGILYFFLEDLDLSLEYYTMALEINYKQNDKKWIAGNTNNIGMIYERKEKYEEALDFYLKSLEMNNELGNKSWIANNYGNIGSLYQLMNDPSSLGYFKKRLRIKEEQNDMDGIALSNFLIGNYYVNEKDWKEAIPYLSKAYNLALISQSLSILSRSTGKLSEAYAGLSEFTSALIYEKLNKTFDDSLNLSNNMEKITKLQMQYKNRKEKETENFNYQKSKSIQTLIAIVLFFVLTSIFLIYNRQRFKAKQHKLEQDKLRIGNKLLQEELEFKEKMLQDNIKYLLGINELLTGTIDKFNAIQSNSKPENQLVIKDIISNLEYEINDDIWEDFEIRFNQIHKGFYQKLNTGYPDLSPNEKKLCAFLKLDMTTKEISAITSLSIKSIETARSRLRKKLNISDNSISLPSFLDQI